MSDTIDTEREIRENLVFMENISVTFGKVVALTNVNFKVRKNEVVGLLGDNGAGKSSLIKVLNGYHRIFKGKLYFEGALTQFRSPSDARRAGIETAYQDLALINLMSITRNFFLGREILKKVGPFRFMDMKTMTGIATERISEMGLKNIRTMKAKVNLLSGGERQAIAIGRATYFGAKLLILDEPTASLSVKETEWVLRLVSECRNHGLSIIFITHNPYQIYSCADRIIVLQQGKNYAEVSIKDTSPEHLTELIAGRAH